MAPKLKRHSMTEALDRSGEVMAFLREGDPGAKKPEKGHHPGTPKPSGSLAEERIAVTVRLPRELAHALIDASAERRKNRAENWSQQAIVTEVITDWLLAQKEYVKK